MTVARGPALFGPSVVTDGVRFRIWAPAAKTVELVLTSGQSYPMNPLENGYFEYFVAGIGGGTRYRYRINGKREVPDPASQYQPEGVEGPSEVLDPSSYTWRSLNWHGRPWIETIIYELHVGTFTEQGTYKAVIEHLDDLVELGITAIELMPLAEAPGKCNWGYDGVLLFAPEESYGHPDDLRALIDAAHERGLMVFLDVVYNHFGPQGNYLYEYAPDFFTQKYHTPWGAAIHVGDEAVRAFFLENALMWLESYGFDGLRFDAVQEIRDHAIPGFLTTLASEIHERFSGRRQIHLILENDDNNVHLLTEHQVPDKGRFDAQWDDDFHHALHVVATGERVDYYRDYADDPIGKLLRAMSEGFCYQGDFSKIRNRRRGMVSTTLPPTSFVSFLQNHDQVGNRAFGERIGRLVRPHVLAALLPLTLLSPMIPMLFMGEEWNASTPFLYFCDFEPDLAKLVTEGRRRDFAGFPDFADADERAKIPDPGNPRTFEASRLRWYERTDPEHASWLSLYRKILHLRRTEIVPRLAGIGQNAGRGKRLGERAFDLSYRLGDGSTLQFIANLSDDPLHNPPRVVGRLLYATDRGSDSLLAPWSVRIVMLGDSLS